MQYVADLHLHSKYSRAVSQQMILPVMAQYAQLKGIDILSVSDWTHGLWFKEIRSQLEEAGEGIYKLKYQISNLKSTSQNSKIAEREPLFLLSTEISCIYSQGGKLRRMHNLVFAPNFETAEKINKALFGRGCNLLSDGRPIIGMSSKALLELILSIDERAMLIPAHAWTPHFGIYGSASGFDSIEECFGNLSSNIYAVETGLSSDPEMNWQIKELQNRSLVSFSDAHSPAKMGRECTVFELEKPSYENIRRAIMRVQVQKTQKTQNTQKSGISEPSQTWSEDQIIRNSDLSDSQNIRRSEFSEYSESKIIYTIEFYPEEGKYHYSGHRNCGIVLGPEDVANDGKTCPVCKRQLTEGVLVRVQQLGGKTTIIKASEKTNQTGLKWLTDPAKNHPPYVKLVPLLEIIAESLNSTVFSQKVKDMFNNLCTNLDSEINLLLKSPIGDIEKIAGVKVAEGVLKVRKGDIVVKPGFDGEYGKVKIWQEKKEAKSMITGKDVNVQEVKEESQLGLF